MLKNTKYIDIKKAAEKTLYTRIGQFIERRKEEIAKQYFPTLQKEETLEENTKFKRMEDLEKDKEWQKLVDSLQDADVQKFTKDVLVPYGDGKLSVKDAKEKLKKIVSK
jgi:DNA topoisomerase VI subunit B